MLYKCGILKVESGIKIEDINILIQSYVRRGAGATGKPPQVLKSYKKQKFRPKGCGGDRKAPAIGLKIVFYNSPLYYFTVSLKPFVTVFPSASLTIT